MIQRAAVLCVIALAMGTYTEDALAAPGDLVSTLDNPAPAVDDRFGNSVAIDGNLVVVGAFTDSPGGVFKTGSAYVFDATNGALLVTLENPEPSVEDFFGKQVGIAGNLVVVSAQFDNPGGVFRAGTAYVFNAETGDLVSTLDNPTPAVFDVFGNSVAIAGNLVVVGAPRDDPSGVFDAGEAYVFNLTTGAVVTLVNPAPAVSAFFGNDVALFGNLAVVGATDDNPDGIFRAGTAYVFNATTGDLVATLKNPTPAAFDNFGWSVAIAGNLVVVGARTDNPGGISGAGTAYVFNATTGTLLVTLDNPAPAVLDVFGNSVAIDGNLAVVGARLDDPDSVADAGTAYVFNATTGALLVTLDNPAPAVFDSFGSAVAIDCNLAVVGAWVDDPGGVGNAGTAYVFEAPSAVATTPAGADVLVELAPQDGACVPRPVKLTFADVGVSGNTTASVSDTGSEPPLGFRLGTPNIYWTLSTDAVLAGGSDIEVCLDYTGIAFGSSLENLLLAQSDGGGWVEVPSSNDTTDRIICGVTTSLSEFAILEVADPVLLLEDLANTVAAFNLKKGISNAMDAKLDAVERAITDAIEQNDLVAINVLDAFINAVEAQRGKELSDDEANDLILRAQEIALVLAGAVL